MTARIIRIILRRFDLRIMLPPARMKARTGNSSGNEGKGRLTNSSIAPVREKTMMRI